MTATKIINVVKDDTFDEVFDIFKNTAAEEVIFILPKKTKAFSKVDHFEAIQVAAKELGKKVALLSSNPDTVTLAKEHDFEILQEKVGAVKPKKSAKAVKPVLAAAEDDVPDDDDLVPDSSDAFDPHSPSDETMGVIDDEKEEEGRDVDTEEILEDDAHAEEKEENVADETEEVKEDAKDQPSEDDEIDESEYIQPDNDLYQEADADYARVQQSKRPQTAGRLAAAAAKHRKAPSEHDNLDELAEVWQQGAKDESVWGPAIPKKGFLSRLFSRSPERVRIAPRLTKVQPPQRKSRRVLYTSLALLLIAGSGYAYIAVGSAKIVITPLSRQLDFEMTANASDQFPSIDAVFGKLPGQLFTINKSVTQEFSTSGKRDVAAKAKGKITVYNTFSTAPQVLIATTRLESSNNLIFRTLRTVTVPGMSGSTPGSVEVEVIADKTGSIYNIAPGKFTVPAFKEKGDTARYEKFYGESKAKMVDGSSGQANVVTLEDYTKAVETVTAKLKDEIRQTLETEASGLKIARIDDVTVSAPETSVQPDQAADTFTVTVKGTLKTVGFKEEDLFALIKDHAARNFGLAVLPERLGIRYEDVQFNESSGVLDMTMKVSGNGYGQVQTAKIISDLSGKGETDIVGYLKQAEGVAEAKVLLTPFWVKKVPKKANKVNVELDYR